MAAASASELDAPADLGWTVQKEYKPNDSLAKAASFLGLDDDDDEAPPKPQYRSPARASGAIVPPWLRDD